MELPLFHVTMPPLEKELPLLISATHPPGLDPPPTIQGQDPGSVPVLRASSSQTLAPPLQPIGTTVPIPDQVQANPHSISHGIFF